MTKHSNSAPFFNAEAHVKELNERFARLVKNLGSNNRRVFSKDDNTFIDEGSERYQFEVDFAFALNEIQNCPPYMQGKMFDKASGVVSNLINRLKVLRESGEAVAA